jgi:N-acetylglucosaminyl-diphospho-decaprenol L-rhamnosyltransferase
MTTSVVIVSFRPGDWLEPCVASVIDQADQVIVVDNGSEGASASAIGGRCGAETVRSKFNRGFTGGVIAGMRRARGDVVALLNDDAVADPGWLKAAEAALEGPGVAAVTPKVLLSGWWGEVAFDDQPWHAPGDRRPFGRRVTSVRVGGVEVLHRALGVGLHRLEGEGFGDVEKPVRWRWTAGQRPFYVPLGPDGEGPVTVNGQVVEVQAVVRLLNHAGSWFHADGTASEIALGQPDDGRMDRPGRPFGFSGTAPVFRGDALKWVGGLSKPFFAYSEDSDWCLRAHLAGLHVAYEPSAVVRHRLSATSGGPRSPLVRLLTERNAALCLVRNAPEPVVAATIEKIRSRDRADPVRKSFEDLLPWGRASRFWLRRRWNLEPEEVWARWADVEPAEDPSPADLAWIARNRPPGDMFATP